MSDLSEVLFVLKLCKLLCKNITFTTICIFKKNTTLKKYLDNNDFLLNEIGHNFFWQAALTSYAVAY